MSVKHLYLVAVAAIIGCAPASGTSGASGPSATPRRSDLLTAEEIAAAHADITTAYDALSRLRPNWLAAHGAMSSNPQVSEFATVFVDGQRYGGLNSLRNIQAYQVADIRYYDVTQAGATFGLRGGTGGAIEVTMKSP
ncbi:MAG TPA: hypothetical protein VHE82_01720 [Gemmatimonadaceae bacterium]|nr:hypothetical protein [Gemmatimonadaceae bacterium]